MRTLWPEGKAPSEQAITKGLAVDKEGNTLMYRTWFGYGKEAKVGEREAPVTPEQWYNLTHGFPDIESVRADLEAIGQKLGNEITSITFPKDPSDSDSKKRTIEGSAMEELLLQVRTHNASADAAILNLAQRNPALAAAQFPRQFKQFQDAGLLVPGAGMSFPNAQGTQQSGTPQTPNLPEQEPDEVSAAFQDAVTNTNQQAAQLQKDIKALQDMMRAEGINVDELAGSQQ